MDFRAFLGQPCRLAQDRIIALNRRRPGVSLGIEAVAHRKGKANPSPAEQEEFDHEEDDEEQVADVTEKPHSQDMEK
jgi:hypothetical protein